MITHPGPKNVRLLARAAARYGWTTAADPLRAVKISLGHGEGETFARVEDDVWIVHPNLFPTWALVPVERDGRAEAPRGRHDRRRTQAHERAQSGTIDDQQIAGD